MSSSKLDLISRRRERVLTSYREAELINLELLDKGDDKATAEYIFPNQKEDAMNIVNLFYQNKCLVVSIQKKTKVGADGLMIEIAKLLTTHPDDDFVVNLENVKIITGMSNAGWEKDMIEKAPNCFKDKIFHHGKLTKVDLREMRNGLIIIDEIDTGDGEFQRLHTALYEAGVLDIEYMKKNNNKFVFISATMIKNLYHLYTWGDLHQLYKMTIPSSYIGHKDFLERGVIQEFYPLTTQEKAEEWIQTDILDNYGTDYRVHIVRVNTKSVSVIRDACIIKRVMFRNHTSTDRLTEDEIKEFFKEPLTQHIVLGVKGFFRRANLIPNRWKLRIGATHELYTRVVDNNVQIQGLPGRITGYWRSEIEAGHKTGPHRTSTKAIEEYEKNYEDPFGSNPYKTSGFRKDQRGDVYTDGDTFVSSEYIENLEATAMPESKNDPRTIPIILQATKSEYETIKKNNGEWDYSTIHPIIQKYNPAIIPEIQRIASVGGRDLITEPNSDSTYSSCILDFVNAARDKKKHRHGGNIQDKTKDTFQIYLDKREYRIVISFYYGTKVKKEE